MTRAQFRLIARALAVSRPEAGSCEWGQWKQDRDALASALATTNENFDRHVFYAATEA